MTKIEELENKLNECQKELAELKESKKEVSGKWRPAIKSDYWFKRDDGVISWNTWVDDEVDNWRINNIPIFQTEEECEKYWKFRDAVKEKSYEFSREEWEDDIYKYLIMYDFCDECFVVDTTAFLKSLDEIYFKTEADAQYIIDNYKEELLKYWL